ncbi:MAG: 3-dehydroquinate synthase [Rhodospirillaceae bacterium]|nr:3-dehydroquinate synthase [Rhodospirillaceae bacterium]
MTTDGTTIERLGVDLGDRSYDILIGNGLLADAGRLIAPVLRAPRVAVITDQNVVDAGHLATLETALAAADIAFRTIILEPGEQTKDFAHLERVIGDLLAGGIDRKTSLIALGGGVIGDLTGVCAALTLRGIDFVQVPTTLLAQVDSSVGGKTAINTTQGKNLVGAFYQPRLVLADTGVLDTLPVRELQAGYAEVVKYGVIDMPDFFEWLEGNGPALLAGDAAARRHAILTCCDAKARIVSSDETEQGQRALLNLGHTFGHALEAETGYGGGLLHGEAVAIGMVMALTLSNRLGHCPGNDAARLRAHLDATGLPADFTRLNADGWTADRLLAHMMKDKKTEDGKLTFILARAIGAAFIEHDVPTGPVADVLTEFLSARG